MRCLKNNTYSYLYFEYRYRRHWRVASSVSRAVNIRHGGRIWSCCVGGSERERRLVFGAHGTHSATWCDVFRVALLEAPRKVFSPCRPPCKPLSLARYCTHNLHMQHTHNARLQREFGIFMQLQVGYVLSYGQDVEDPFSLLTPHLLFGDGSANSFSYGIQVDEFNPRNGGRRRFTMAGG